MVGIKELNFRDNTESCRRLSFEYIISAILTSDVWMYRNPANDVLNTMLGFLDNNV